MQLVCTSRQWFSRSIEVKWYPNFAPLQTPCGRSLFEWACHSSFHVRSHASGIVYLIQQLHFRLVLLLCCCACSFPELKPRCFTIHQGTVFRGHNPWFVAKGYNHCERMRTLSRCTSLLGISLSLQTLCSRLPSVLDTSLGFPLHYIILDRFMTSLFVSKVL